MLKNYKTIKTSEKKAN